MLRRSHLLVLALQCMLHACTKQDETTPVAVAAGCRSAIVINEVLAGGGTEKNEFGEVSDLLELYNAGNDAHLEPGAWFLTDDPDDLLKYELPSLTLREEAFLSIWCDGEDVVVDQVHTSFQLAAEGEWLALVHVDANGICVVDSVRYPAQQAAEGRSYGRYPDGTQAWHVQETATFGGPNAGPAEQP